MGFPGEAVVAGGVGVETGAGGGVEDVPLLGGGVESDVGGAGDGEGTEVAEVDEFGIEGFHAAARGEAEGGHEVW